MSLGMQNGKCVVPKGIINGVCKCVRLKNVALVGKVNGMGIVNGDRYILMFYLGIQNVKSFVPVGIINGVCKTC